MSLGKIFLVPTPIGNLKDSLPQDLWYSEGN